MRKILVVYLAFAVVLMGGLSAVAQTLDLQSVSQLTRAKQMAKQEKAEYVAKTLASAPVQQALQKTGLKLSPKDAEALAKYAPPRKLDLLYSQCVNVNQALAMGQYGAGGGMGMLWLILGLAALIILIVLLVVLLAADDYYYDPYYYWQ